MKRMVTEHPTPAQINVFCGFLFGLPLLPGVLWLLRVPIWLAALLCLAWLAATWLLPKYFEKYNERRGGYGDERPRG